MTWLRSCDPAESTCKRCSVTRLVTRGPRVVIFGAIILTPTCGVLLREGRHGDLSRCDGGGLQSQAGERVDDHVGGHGGVSVGRELAAGVGDEAGVDAQGLREEPPLL